MADVSTNIDKAIVARKSMNGKEEGSAVMLLKALVRGALGHCGPDAINFLEQAWLCIQFSCESMSPFKPIAVYNLVPPVRGRM